MRKISLTGGSKGEKYAFAFGLKIDAPLKDAMDTGNKIPVWNSITDGYSF